MEREDGLRERAGRSQGSGDGHRQVGDGVSPNGQPRRTSAAIRGFKIWFGGIFLAIGVVSLLAAIGIYLLFGQSFGRVDEIWAFIAAPLGLGLSFSALGGTFVALGVAQTRQE